MRLEKQICNLSQAKKLKELGVDQNSQFYFVPWKASDFDDCFIGQKCDKGFFHCLDGRVETFDAPESFSAFSMAEIGCMFELVFDDEEKLSAIPQEIIMQDDSGFASFKMVTEGLIWSLENGKITADECSAILAK